MKKRAYCKSCGEYTEQEHMERKICVCRCGQMNTLGVKPPKRRKPRTTKPGRPGRPPVLTAAQVEEAVRLRLAKMKWAGIANRFGCSVPTVCKAVKAYKAGA